MQLRNLFGTVPDNKWMVFVEATVEPRWLLFASEGNKIAECQNFQFNYGGRRGFCKVEYADLGNSRDSVFS